jgi:hypothetical protein
VSASIAEDGWVQLTFRELAESFYAKGGKENSFLSAK